jgi:peptidoglycan glycosyltransferase
MVTGAIGNKGVMMNPCLVKEIHSPEGKVLWEQDPRFLRVVAEPEIAGQVQEGMLSVVQPGGTGTAASLPGIEVVGKTGSAENPAGRTHAWFVASAPAHLPEVAVSVIIEHGGQGGSAAAPIAREIIKLALSGEG